MTRSSLPFIADQDFILLERLRSEIGDPSKRVIAFVGSGLSRLPPANLPGWLQLADLLIQEMQSVYGPDDVRVDKAQQLVKALKVADFDVDFLILVFKKLSDLMGVERFAATIVRLLQADKKAIPDVVQELLRTRFTGFITTNLDQLLEKAAQNCEPFNLILRGPHATAEQLPRENNWLWKIHGCVTDPNNWVFTTDSYLQTRRKDHTYTLNLSALVQSSRFVFFGFGGGDPNISWLIQTLTADYGARSDQHIIIARAPDDLDPQFLRIGTIRPIYYSGPDYATHLLPLVKYLQEGNEVARALAVPAEAATTAEIISKLQRNKDSPKLPIFVRSFLGNRSASVDSVLAEMDIVEHEPAGGAIPISPTPIRYEDLLGTGSLILAGDSFSGRSTLLRRMMDDVCAPRPNQIPLFISCKELSELIGTGDKPRTLDQLVQRWLGFQDYLSDAERTLISRLNHCCIVLDDVDAVVNVGQVQRFLSNVEALGHGRKQLVVFASMSDVNPISSLLPIPVYQVVGLSEIGIRTFVVHWTAQLKRAGLTIETLDRGAEFIEFLLEDEQLFRLAQSPVLLGELLSAFLRGVLESEQLPRLLQQAVSFLFDRRGRLSTALSLAPPVARELAARVSWEVLTAGQPDARYIKLGVLRNVIQSVVRADTLDRTTVSDPAVEFVRESGLFRFRGIDEVTYTNFNIASLMAGLHCAATIATGGDIDEILGRVEQSRSTQILDYLAGSICGYGFATTSSFFEYLTSALERCSADALPSLSLLFSRLIESSSQAGFAVPSSETVRPILSAIDDAAYRGTHSIAAEERFRAGLARGSLTAFVGDREEIDWISFDLTDRGRETVETIDAAVCWEIRDLAPPRQPFELSRSPILVRQFRDFIDSAGYETRTWWTDDGWQWLNAQRVKFPASWTRQRSRLNIPVVGVSWYEANAFCRWLAVNAPTGRNARLPKECEWHWVATEHRRRGVTSVFPWGVVRLSSGEQNEINWAGVGLLKPSPVGIFPKGTTASGILDLLGNVEEWCDDAWSLPTSAASLLEYAKQDSPMYRVVRGGSAIRAGIMCRPAYRSRCQQDKRYPTIGFRIARTS